MNRIKLRPKGPVRVLHGEGLGEIIGREEGLRRLHEYAIPKSRLGKFCEWVRKLWKRT